MKNTRINGIPLRIHWENFKYYLFQYRVDKYYDYKRIRIDKNKPIFGYGAEPCGRKYCMDCGGSRWRKNNKEDLPLTNPNA